LGPSKAVATIVLLLLAALLIASFMTNDVDLWILWSRLGDEEFYIVVAVVLYHFLPRLQQGLTLITAVLLSGSLNIALKYTFNLPRPPDPLIDVSGPSFPSGHAQISSSFWSSFSLMTRDAVIAIMSAIIIMGISSSRVSLRAHYVVDVVFGALIGCALGCASYLALRYHSSRRPFAGHHINVGIAVVLSAYNIIALRAELNSSTALLGLGLAALTALPTLRFTETGKPSTLARMLACVISIVLLLGAHMTTRDLVPYVRSACFYVAGLCAFLMALALQKFLKRSLERGNIKQSDFQSIAKGLNIKCP